MTNAFAKANLQTCYFRCVRGFRSAKAFISNKIENGSDSKLFGFMKRN